MDNCIAIIPARGGSKRIPKKNIKNFLGKPIISYTIEAAKESNLFDEIMVSTDSVEIAEIAMQCGAVVPFLRRSEMSNDYVTTDDVLLDVLQEYKKVNREFCYMACIYPTAPFVTAASLQNAMKMLETHSKASMVMPVAAFSYPPQRCYTIDEEGMVVFKHPEYITSRSQDLEILYHEVGQYYIFNVEKFIKAEGKVYENIIPIVVDEMSVQDIDQEKDWKLAEMKYKIINKEI